jgi:hypothetical protein
MTVSFWAGPLGLYFLWAGPLKNSFFFLQKNSLEKKVLFSMVLFLNGKFKIFRNF